MTPRQSLLTVVAVVGVVETLLYCCINRLSRDFPWLLTKRNLLPVPPDDALLRFSQDRSDHLLGWAPAKGSTGTELADGRATTFSIAMDGSRNCSADTEGSTIAVVVGDSFGFGRLVRDEEAWPCQLAGLTKRPVVNWSVGNYGIDQALLRLESQIESTSSDWVIACVVPETICRVRSSWKHFFEYGNCLAFKPHFAVVNGSLKLTPAGMAPQNSDEYLTRAAHARANDYFYRRKFLRDRLSQPYTLSFLRRPLRHGAIILALLVSQLRPLKAFGRRAAQRVVFRDNARWTRRLFRDAESLRLLEAILLRLRTVSLTNGRQFLLVVIPQLSDLSRRRRLPPWSSFLASLANDSGLEVLDFTSLIQSLPPRLRSLYFVSGTLGPHLSAQGNRLVAEMVRDRIHAMSDRGSRA